MWVQIPPVTPKEFIMINGKRISEIRFASVNPNPTVIFIMEDGSIMHQNEIEDFKPFSRSFILPLILFSLSLKKDELEKVSISYGKEFITNIDMYLKNSKSPMMYYHIQNKKQLNYISRFFNEFSLFYERCKKNEPIRSTEEVETF